MIRIAMLVSVFAAGCGVSNLSSDDSTTALKGHWDLFNCDGGIYEAPVTIFVHPDRGPEIIDQAYCYDISFATLVPSDAQSGYVEIYAAGGYFETPFSLQGDADIGLVTFGAILED